MKGDAEPRVLPCAPSLHRTGPLRLLVQHDEFVHVLRHLSHDPAGAFEVPSASTQAPHRAFARQAVAQVVRPAPEAQKDGELFGVEVDADLQPLRSVGVVQTARAQLARRNLVHVGSRQVAEQLRHRRHPDAHAVSPGIKLTQGVMLHQVLAAGIGLGRGQGGVQEGKGTEQQGDKAKGGHGLKAFYARGVSSFASALTSRQPRRNEHADA